MKLNKYLFLLMFPFQWITAQNVIINQDAINANYDHINGNILIEPLQNDITVSGLFIYEIESTNTRNVTIKPFNGYGISIIPATGGPKNGGLITRLAGCKEEDDVIPPELPNNFKSLTVTQSTITNYEVYNLSGVLIKKENQQALPYDKMIFELPKNQIYIIKVHHNDGSMITEKIIHQ